MRGKDVGEEAKEEDASYLTKKDLQEYLEKKKFKGFKKTPENDDFFSVFSALFKKIDKEEEMEEDTKTVHREAAEFGDINFSREDVMKFY